MKLYSLYSPSHEILLNDWFLKTLQDDFDLEIRQIPQTGSPLGNAYGSKPFIDTVLMKVDLILEAIRENAGEVFVFSDIDIQFFGATLPTLERLIQGRDMVFQRNAPNGEINTGFFACRSNEQTEKLWSNVRSRMVEVGNETDQKVANDLILGNPHAGRNKAWFRYIAPTLKHLRVGGAFCDTLCRRNQNGLSWSYLPETFYCPGLSWPKAWVKGTPLNLPKGLLMHHANWNAGPTVDEKVAQLDYVQNCVSPGPTG